MQDLRDHKGPQALLDLKARLEIPVLRETLDLPAHKATQVPQDPQDLLAQQDLPVRLEQLVRPALLDLKASKAFKV
jgi:hypothetical protein